MKRSILLGLLGLVASSAAQSTPAGLTSDQLDLVRGTLAMDTDQSWVLGTIAEALLEIQYSQYSVFGPGLPDLSEQNLDEIPLVQDIVQGVVSNIPAGQLQLMPDESAADPASLGVPVLLAAMMQSGELNYMEAAANQLEALMQAPRSPSGAISHRQEEAQLWSDSVYMTPPFLAFYGLVQNNETLLQMAYDQCRLYRDELLTDEYLWAHVRLGSWQDDGAWATGNAWAAMGIMRVYATIEKSSFRESMSAQLVELGNWAAQITQQSWRYRSPITGGLYNYLGSDSTSQFVDLAATALMAAATYRVSQYGIDDSMIPYAEGGRIAVQASIDSYGWVHNVVDPISWEQLAEHSPEGQAFTLLMHAGWRDWQRVSDADIQSRRKRSLGQWQ